MVSIVNSHTLKTFFHQPVQGCKKVQKAYYAIKPRYVIDFENINL